MKHKAIFSGRYNEMEFAEVIQGETGLSANGQTVIFHEGKAFKYNASSGYRFLC